MAKGPGGTRTSSSANPTGNGGRRVNASAPVPQMLIEDRIIPLEAERERLRATRNAADSIRADQLTELIDELRNNPQTAVRLQDLDVKLTQSDLKLDRSLDDERNEETTWTDTKLYRWDVKGIAYKDGGETRYSRATITQFLNREGGVGGYEIYFDKAYPVGEARTLEEAKQKLLNYINNKRR